MTRESTEKERFQILMEEMKSQFKAVLENQSSIKQELKTDTKNLKFELTEKIGLLQKAIKQNSLDINQNSSDIKGLKQDVNQNSLDIKELRQDVKQNSSDIKELRQDVKQNSSDIKELKLDVNQTHKAMQHVLTEHEHEIKKLKAI